METANKKSVTGLSKTINKFNAKAVDTQSKLDRNPFSDTYAPPEHKVTDDRYGRPEKGSLTERRGIAAGSYVFREIIFLCEIISKYGKQVSREIFELCEVISESGQQGDDDGTTIVRFGYLFQLYTRISDKVVGMLLRARKYGLVHFEGEMLYQRRDDNVIITLLKPLNEIRESFKESGDPARCVAQKSS